MNCKKCGAPLSVGDQFCKSCGASVSAESNNIGTNNIVNNTVNESLSNSQSTWNQANQSSSYHSMSNNNGNSGNNAKYIILGVVVVAIIIALVLAFYFVFGNSSPKEGDNPNPDAVQTSNKSSYKVNFKGFTFSIPDDLIYEVSGDLLFIGDELGTWMAQVEVEQGSFAQLSANINQLQPVLQQSGYTVSAAEEKILGGLQYITLEINAGGQNAIVGLAKVNSMHFAAVTALNLDNEFDYSILETVAPIINSAELSETTTNMEASTNIDMSGILPFAQ